MPTPTDTPIPVTVVYQQGVGGYLGTTDATIHAWYPTTNYGTIGALSLRADDIASGLIRFGLDIPTGSQVLDATLELYVLGRTNGNRETVSTYRLLRPWHPDQATWQQAAAGSSWTVPGANGIGSDRTAEATDATTLDSVGYWIRLNVADLVQTWVHDPSANNGLILRATGSRPVQYDVASSEYGAWELRPRLTVTYLPIAP
ncbi:MAG TPA: DNRLRE domain-containing protein [Anaerolineae bacterium]|nr:DNRLRE domain-containing protein [Anaerolineae bacterium]HIQ06253.1 DNRLRE domain-containing protein [Anaerolineae bacterium]